MNTFMDNKKRIFWISLVCIFAFSLTQSCNNTVKGGALGGTLGGALGGLIGKRSGNTTAGILVGTAIGGAAGSAIGNYMDKQANELKSDLENAKVERVGEGIKITFDSGILFEFDESSLTQNSENNVESLASTLKEYDETNIIIQGYTDSIGSKEYNKNLSERRALSVAQELINNNVEDDRLQVEGYGEQHPVATNATEYGRQQNRRVEVAIMANERLKEAAKENKSLTSL